MSNSVTPSEAKRLVKHVVEAHNADCVNAIAIRIRKGALQVGVVEKGAKFFTCSTLAQVAAFADGVADVEGWGEREIPAREFNFAEEKPAYEAGVAATVATSDRESADFR